MTAAERLAEQASWHAARLVGAVHDEGPDVVAALLADAPAGRLDAVCVALAAMVDPDRTPGELLAWTDWAPSVPVLKPCKGRSARRRHDRRGEECWTCWPTTGRPERRSRAA